MKAHITNGFENMQIWLIEQYISFIITFRTQTIYKNNIKIFEKK